MSRPVLSICIPSFNRETLALELLHELDAPGFLPFAFEVLLVDNASTASAYDTVRTFAPRHYPFRYLRLPRTVSAFSNVMGALRRASGELCMYLADDDRLAPDALAETIAVMQAQPAILATYCTWDLIDLADGRVVRAATPLEEAVFSEATAAEPLTGLVRRAGLPEIGVYRTATLPGSLLPTRDLLLVVPPDPAPAPGGRHPILQPQFLPLCPRIGPTSRPGAGPWRAPCRSRPGSRSTAASIYGRASCRPNGWRSGRRPRPSWPRSAPSRNSRSPRRSTATVISRRSTSRSA
ncbi:MAG: glycosyltransferase family 2 protein [Pseudomonadota bacterium]